MKNSRSPYKIKGTMTGFPEWSRNWHITAACHVIFFLVIGIVRISGLIFAASITHFDVDREHASLPFVCGTVVRAIACLLGGYLGHTMGLRTVIIAGCVLCSLGIGACFFADDILTLTICWSTYGLGSGMTAPIIPLVLNEYFFKHNTKANGIAMAGAPLGGFVLAPVVAVLLKEYGVSGTFLILSAIFLHSIPAAMLLKKPDFRTLQVSAIPKGTLESQNKSHDKLFLNNQQILRNKTPTGKSLKESNGSKWETPENFEAPILKPEMFECKSKNVVNYHFHADASPKNRFSNQRDTCLEIFSIFWDPIFHLLAIPLCVLQLCYSTIQMFLVDFLNDKGFSLEQSTYLLMVYAALDLVGKLCLGFITDSKYVSRTKFAALLYSILAASFVVMVFANSFVVMILALAVEALCTGGIQPLHPGLVREYLETGKQTMAVASAEILLLPLRVSSVSLIGYFRDDLGSYSGFLYLLSAASVFSTALLMGLLGFAPWREKRRKLSQLPKG